MSPAGPPINQHPDCDSHCTGHSVSNGKEWPSDSHCLDLHFDKTVVVNSETDLTEHLSNDNRFDYCYETANYFLNTVGEVNIRNSLPSTMPRNISPVVTRENYKTISNDSNTHKCTVIKEIPVKECGKRTLSNSIEYTNETKEEEQRIMNLGIPDNCEIMNVSDHMNSQNKFENRLAKNNVAITKKIGKEQSGTSKNNIEECDVGGTENKEDINCDSLVVCMENEKNTVNGQENDSEQLVDDHDNDNDLYGIKSVNTVSSSCETLTDSTLYSEESEKITGSSSLCNVVNNGFKTSDVSECEELPPSLKKYRKANIEQIGNSSLHQTKKRRTFSHWLKINCQKGQEIYKLVVDSRKPEDFTVIKQSISDWIDRVNKRRVSKKKDNINKRRVSKKKDDVNKQLIGKCKNKRSSKKKDKVRPLFSMETPVESLHTMDDVADTSHMTMGTHSERNSVRIRYKNKPLSTYKRKLYVHEEIKHCMKKQKLSGGKCNWTVVEHPVIKINNAEGNQSDIVKSVDEEKNKQRQPSHQFQASDVRSKLHSCTSEVEQSCEPQAMVQLQSPVQSEMLEQQSELSAQCQTLSALSNSSSQLQTFSPYKDGRNTLQSCTSEVKQPCEPQAMVQLQSPVQSEMLEQESELSVQSQTLSVLLQCSILQQSSLVQGQVATPYELSSQDQASVASCAVDQQLSSVELSDQPSNQLQSCTPCYSLQSDSCKELGKFIYFLYLCCFEVSIRMKCKLWFSEGNIIFYV